jgi:hypothetical protein
MWKRLPGAVRLTVNDVSAIRASAAAAVKNARP